MPGPTPRPAIWLGVAGLVPFVAGALAAHGMVPGIGNPVTGYLILQAWGAAQLALLGGCLIGFAVKAGRPGWKALTSAAVPPLWAFAATFAPNALAALTLGHALVLGLELVFSLKRIAPGWWLRLRLPLAAVTLACLAAGWLA